MRVAVISDLHANWAALRASYAVIEDGEVRLERFAYPVEEAVRAVQHTFHPQPAAFLTGVLRTGKAG